MRNSSIRKLAFASALVLFSVPCFATDTGNAMDMGMEMGTQSVDNAWVKAMQANDLDAVLKLYAADAVVWFPNEKEARGSDAIRATYQGLLDANTVVSVSVSDTGYRMMGDVSAGWGKFSLTLKPKAGGDPVVMTGRFTEVTEKRDGQWVYIVDHGSAEPPATEAAKM